MTAFADTPEPPYYAVIFASERTAEDREGYDRASATMMELAPKQPGFLRIESARNEESGFGITVSYWQSEEAIAAWKAHAKHVIVQRLGRERWYRSFRLRVALVERQRSWTS